MSEQTTTAPSVESFTVNPFEILVKAINSANEIGAKIKAAKSDKTDAVKEVLNTSTDEKIVKFRTAREQALEQIRQIQARIKQAEDGITAYAEGLVPGVDKNFDVEAATKEFVSRRAAAYAARKSLEFFAPAEQIDAALKAQGVAEIVNLRGTGKGGAKGASGIKRPRISAATYNGEPVANKDGKVDFTTLGKASGLDSGDLKAAAFKAAGTDDLNSLDAGTVINFEIGDKKFSVTVSDVKPGRKPGEKKAEAESK